MQQVHNISIAPFAEYVPFTNFYKDRQAKACLVKGWKSLDSVNAKFTIEDCPNNTWIQRRLRVTDNAGNYQYCGLIVVDVDDSKWFEIVFNKIKEEQIKCQIRRTKRGGHLIFRFVPNHFNAATSDYLFNLNIPEPSESTHQTTPFITDPIVDYKFTEIVRHIVNVKGDYVGRVSDRFDHVVLRDICYDEHYSEIEQLKRNKAEQLPEWFPAYDDIPDWLIPNKSEEGIIPMDIMFRKEVVEMVGLSDSYTNEKQQLDIAQFMRCLNSVFTYKLVVNSNKDRELYIYDEGFYQLISEQDFISIITSILLNLDISKYKDCSGYAKSICEQFINHTRTSYICNYTDMNADENIVNFKNGVLDLRTGELKLHSPRYLSSIQIPCKWDTSSDTPEPEVFMKYIHQLTDGLPDQQQIISMILQYCGCCISNVPVYRTKGALIFQGKSNAGKSQIFNMMFDLLGNRNSMPSDLQVLSTNRFASSNIYGKRLTGHSDLQHNTSIESAGIFRQLTSGDIIYAEEKYKGTYNFKFSGGLIYCCNELPRFKDEDQALYNRLYIVSCNNEIPEKDRDPELLKKFQNEYPQIIKLMLRELIKLKNNDWVLYSGGTVSEQRDNYEVEKDNIMEFIEIAVAEDNEGFQTKQTIQFWYDAYISFCREYRYSGIQILRKRNFQMRFERLTHCQRTRINNHRCYDVYPTIAAMKLKEKML
jgi:P4 family phage/plasmid primase-like protien